jgi:hypothetical protein
VRLLLFISSRITIKISYEPSATSNTAFGECDEVIVFSGDGDFAYLYEFVVGQLHKRVSVFSPLKYPASLLTSGKLKDLDKAGCINLYNLESVAQHRAVPL